MLRRGEIAISDADTTEGGAAACGTADEGDAGSTVPAAAAAAAADATATAVAAAGGMPIPSGGPGVAGIIIPPAFIPPNPMGPQDDGTPQRDRD